MITGSIFEELRLPVAREKGWLPIFFDFTVGNSPEDYTLLQVIHEIVSQTSVSIDGIILSTKKLPDTESLNELEIWARLDQTPAFHQSLAAKEKTLLPLINSGGWDQRDISGVVGTLIMGDSATHEADNIQYLAALRSHSFDIGKPMAIDLHVLDEGEDGENYTEIVELGLNLAIELGCDMVIVPGGDYLATNQNIAKISELPILARQSLSSFAFEVKPSEIWWTLLTKIDGIIFSDTRHWKNLIDHPQILQMGINSFEIKPVGE